jgi:uncharacterized protein (DUF1778 family)
MTTPITEQEYAARLHEIAKPITRHYHTNPIVQDIARRYAAGDILTKEEALYQMVEQLSEVLDVLQHPTSPR